MFFFTPCRCFWPCYQPMRVHPFISTSYSSEGMLIRALFPSPQLPRTLQVPPFKFPVNPEKKKTPPSLMCNFRSFSQPFQYNSVAFRTRAGCLDNIDIVLEGAAR